MANPYFIIPKTGELIYNGDKVVLSEFPDNVAIASYGWYIFHDVDKFGWYFLIIETDQIVPKDDVDLDLINKYPKPCPDPPSDDRAFITVETIEARDSLDTDYMPDGRIVRVNTVSEGDPLYYQWDKVNQSWITWDISSEVSKIDNKQNKSVYSYQFVPPYLADKNDYFEIGDIWTVRGEFGLRAYILTESPGGKDYGYYWYPWRPITTNYISSGFPDESPFVEHEDYAPIGKNAPLIHKGIDIPLYFDGEFASSVFDGSDVIPGQLKQLVTLSWNVPERKYMYKWNSIPILAPQVPKSYNTTVFPKGQSFFFENDPDVAINIKNSDSGYDGYYPIMTASFNERTYSKITISVYKPPALINMNNYKLGDLWVCKSSTGIGNSAYGIYVLKYHKYDTGIIQHRYKWEALVPYRKSYPVFPSGGTFPYHDYTGKPGNSERSYPECVDGDIIYVDGSSYRCQVSSSEGSTRYSYIFERIPSELDTYTKNEVNDFISAFRDTIIKDFNPPYQFQNNVYEFKIGDKWINSSTNRSYILTDLTQGSLVTCTWKPESAVIQLLNSDPISNEQLPIYSEDVTLCPTYFPGDLVYTERSGSLHANRIWILAGWSFQVTSDIRVTYIWEEICIPENTYKKNEVDTELSYKMDLAPLNPNAAQIAAMPSGQLYGDTVNHKGIIKGGQEFYDTAYIDSGFRKTIISTDRPPIGAPPETNVNLIRVGDVWVEWNSNAGKKRMYQCYNALYNYSPVPVAPPQHYYYWVPLTNDTLIRSSRNPPAEVVHERVTYTIDGVTFSWFPVPEYYVDDVYCYVGTGGTEKKYMLAYPANYTISSEHCTYRYTWEEADYYTKTEIDSMIGDIETALSEV